MLNTNLSFEFSKDVTPSLKESEYVERKGVGHPDTLADTIAEETTNGIKGCLVDIT